MNQVERRKARARAEEKDRLNKMFREGKLTKTQLKNKKGKRK